MTDQITPSRKLVREWIAEAPLQDYSYYIIKQAVQWGANQELEACVAWLDGFDDEGWAAEQLRADRRPKPPSLKEQALEETGN